MKRSSSSYRRKRFYNRWKKDPKRRGLVFGGQSESEKKMAKRVAGMAEEF